MARSRRSRPFFLRKKSRAAAVAALHQKNIQHGLAAAFIGGQKMLKQKVGSDFLPAFRIRKQPPGHAPAVNFFIFLQGIYVIDGEKAAHRALGHAQDLAFFVAVQRRVLKAGPFGGFAQAQTAQAAGSPQKIMDRHNNSE